MPAPGYEGPLVQVSDYCWCIPKSYKAGMRVDCGGEGVPMRFQKRGPRARVLPIGSRLNSVTF